MRRVIQRDVDNRLSELLLGGGLMPGNHVVVDVRDGVLTFEVDTARPAPAGVGD